MAKLQNLARFKKVSESETVSTTTDYHESLFSNTDTVGIHLTNPGRAENDVYGGLLV